MEKSAQSQNDHIDDGNDDYVKKYEHPMSVEDFRKNGYKMIDYMADYYKRMERKEVDSVLSEVEPHYLQALIPKEAPEEGESFESIMKDVDEKIMPGMTHWQHPNFFAYFSANSSYPGMLGEMMSSMFNVIGFSWICSPACTELETIVMDWLAKLMQLPPFYLSKYQTKGFSFDDYKIEQHSENESFFENCGGGVIQSTASESSIVALLGAKSRLIGIYKKKWIDEFEEKNLDGKDRDEEISKRTRDLVGKMVVYSSDQAHSSIRKALMVTGLLDSQMRIIKSSPEDFSMNTEHLQEVMEQDRAKGLVPVIVYATIGTTSSTAVDDLKKIGKICKPKFEMEYVKENKYNETEDLDENSIWLHVDAAFLGSQLVCPEFRFLINGIEYTNSFNFNPHKWLLTNFDCSAMFVKNSKHLVNALSLTPEYLRNKQTDAKTVIDYRDWQVPLGRKFRALKLWFVLRSYGSNGLREYIRHHVELSKRLEKWLREDERFEILAPRTTTLLCFRLKCEDESKANDINKRLLDRLNNSKKTYMVHTVLNGKFTIRFAISGTNTSYENVKEVWTLTQNLANEILNE